MKIALGSLTIAFAVPTLLLVAIALGPVILGVLCAVGFGLIVFAIVNGVVGLGVAARSAERTASRRLRRGSS